MIAGEREREGERGWGEKVGSSVMISSKRRARKAQTYPCLRQ